MHGEFDFDIQRFIIRENEERIHTNFFELTNQFGDGHISDGLKEFSAYYSNRLSYKEVETLMSRVTGERQLSDQKIWQIVVDKASEASEEIEEEVRCVTEDSSLRFPDVNNEVDIYDPNVREVLLFDDGIQVREQKEERCRMKGCSETDFSEESERKKTRVTTDVVILEKKSGEFEYVTSPTDEKGNESVPLEEVVRSKIKKEYGEEDEPLNIVAITDGARNIRLRLAVIFGDTVTIILDWYHLCKKMREYMSMIARDKNEKKKHLKFILYHLWRGMTEEVLEYLGTEVEAKNKKRLAELVAYLEKHEEEIIDYKIRKEAGKTVGSGRGEKGCDQVIGRRQKKKGMSWSKLGNRSLGILKVAELNNTWEGLWFSKKLTDNSQSASHLPLAVNM